MHSNIYISYVLPTNISLHMAKFCFLSKEKYLKKLFYLCIYSCLKIIFVVIFVAYKKKKIDILKKLFIDWFFDGISTHLGLFYTYSLENSHFLCSCFLRGFFAHGPITPCQWRPESNGNEGVLHTPQITRTEASTSDTVYFHTLHFFFWGGVLPSCKEYSKRIPKGCVTYQCKTGIGYTYICHGRLLLLTEQPHWPSH